MKILHRYIGAQLVRSLGISLLVFTFILFMGNLLKLVELLERGVSAGLLVKLFMSFIPYLLTFSLPMSILTASLLTFGRLSADNEITAMRACGIGFSAIFRTGYLLGVVCMVASLYITASLAPRAHYLMRSLRYQVGTRNPEALLEPGVFISYFRPYQLYIGEKDGTTFKDVIIYEELDNNRTRFFKGSSGEISTDEEGHVVFKVYNVKMEEPPREGETQTVAMESNTYQVRMGALGRTGEVPKKMSDLTLGELLGKLNRYGRMLRWARPSLKDDVRRRISIIKTEMSERLVYTFCALAFVIIGMPLGVTTHRAETSIGAAISLLLVALNYSFIICIKAFQESYAFRPHLLLWIPNILFVILGPMLIKKLSSR